MKQKIIPIGVNIVVKPNDTEHYISEKSNLTIVQTALKEGTVMAVSEEMKDLYKEGDIVIYPENSGVSQRYNGNFCLWLNGNGHPLGDIKGIISNE